MKPPLRSLLLAASVALLPAAVAAESAPPPPEESHAFVPMEASDVFNRHTAAAVSAFEDERYDEAMESIEAALAMEPRVPFLHNLAGAVHTKAEDYDAARASYERALEIEPGFFPARFNIGEILFLEDDHEGALEYFRALQQRAPKNELLAFKMVLTHLKLGQPEAAARQLRLIRFPGETPAWYYANGAILLAEGKRGRGMRHIRSARAIYGDQTSLFEESLEQAGML